MERKRPHNEPHEGEIEMHTRSGTKFIGSRMIEHIRETLGVGFKEFIEAQWMFFMATSDDEENMDCNYRGGRAWFCQGS